jgi:hypothetical protein
VDQVAVAGPSTGTAFVGDEELLLAAATPALFEIGEQVL